MQAVDKQKLALRYWLLGLSQAQPEYYKVIRAFEKASGWHVGKRRDGKPEFSHQIAIACYIKTLTQNLIDPKSALIMTAFHDSYEDYPALCSLSDLQAEYGQKVARGVFLLSKFDQGRKKTEQEYFEGLLSCETASIVKGADRVHNLLSMGHAFSPKKKLQYIEETEKWFLPMLKQARRLYPEQSLAYENIKWMISGLLTQKELALEADVSKGVIAVQDCPSVVLAVQEKENPKG